MNSQNHDLVPRPSPKPSQIGLPMISSEPEVPEVSLLFDSNVGKVEPTRSRTPKITTDPQKYIGNTSIPSYSSPSNCERQATNIQERTNCYWSSNLDSSRLNGHAGSIPSRLDYAPNNQHMNFSYEGNGGLNGHVSLTPPRLNRTLSNQFVNSGHDGICPQNPCSHFPTFTKNCVTDYNTTNGNQSFVTLEDYQKMVSQFTKMILNLNYKFNQVLESSVSREELNQITRKFELQVENLTQRVNDLNSKLEKTNTELMSRNVVEYKCCQKNYESVPRHVTEHKCCQIDDRPPLTFEKEFKGNPQVIGQSHKYQGITKTCLRPNDQEVRHPGNGDHQRVDAEELQRERLSSGKLSIRGGMPVNSIPENVELEHVMVNLDLLQQNDACKRCYSSHEHKFQSNNMITPSDVSSLMNTLATKYIPEGQFDNRKQESKPEHDLMVRNDSNNVSIATLQYMERYQLLSSKNQNSAKPLCVTQTRSLSNQQFYHQEMLEGNDQSFLRS